MLKRLQKLYQHQVRLMRELRCLVQEPHHHAAAPLSPTHENCALPQRDEVTNRADGNDVLQQVHFRAIHMHTCLCSKMMTEWTFHKVELESAEFPRVDDNFAVYWWLSVGFGTLHRVSENVQR